jgi:hypothetical membrane protein
MTTAVDRIPWWAVASAGAAPIALGGGLAVAQALQPPGYSAVRDTISALAALGATDRWVMTAGLAALGACHVVTAAGLRPVRLPARLVLAAGGLGTLAVAAFPQPVRGNSVAHTVAATVSFVALGSWPAFATRRDGRAPLLSVPACVAATVGMLALVVWFAADLHGGVRGLSERAAAGAEALWPLAVVVTTRKALARLRR